MSTFYPALAYISSISNAPQAVVTFTANCDFTPGEVVSFRVSQPYGMVEMNNVETTVLSNTSNSITVPVNSSNFTPFVYQNPLLVQSPAIVVPSSSGVVPGGFPAQTNLADAFDNIPNT